jgi:hypothetical protein
MDERARMIAAARRLARRIAKKTELTYQQALDKVARDLGRDHWAAYAADPVMVSRDVMGVCITQDAIVDMGASALLAEVFDRSVSVQTGDEPDQSVPRAVYVLMHDLTAHVAQQACNAFHRRPHDVMDVDAIMRDAGVEDGRIDIKWTDRTAEYLSVVHHGHSVLREIPQGVRIDPSSWVSFCQGVKGEIRHG